MFRSVLHAWFAEYAIAAFVVRDACSTQTLGALRNVLYCVDLHTSGVTMHTSSFAVRIIKGFLAAHHRQLLAALSAAIVTSTHAGVDVSRLPELPTELATDLIQSRDSKVLHTKPLTKLGLPRPAPPAAFCPMNSSADVASFFTYVLYPMVVCQSPWQYDAAVLESFFAKPAPSSVRVPVKPAYASEYKLSSFQDRKLVNPLFCSVRSGPWGAWVKEEEMCTTNCGGLPPATTVEIPAAPQPLVLQWTGPWTDPHPPLYIVPPGGVNNSAYCCPGFKTCNGSCVPFEVNCDDGPAPPPA